MNAPPTLIESADGTRIATEITGSGPAVIVVAAALADRRAARRLAAQLASTCTVYTYDRRGRGATEQVGDRQARDPVRAEIDDIAALVAHAGGTAAVFGSSSGAALALRAAGTLGAAVRQLVLFEPPFIVDGSRPPLGPDFERDIEELLARGDNAGAVRRFMRGLGVPPAMVALMRILPGWRQMVAMAPTLSHDLAVLSGTQLGSRLPADLAEGVVAPTAILTGGKSDSFFASAAEAVAAAIPNARHHVVPRLNHAAVEAAPARLAEAIRGILDVA